MLARLSTSRASDVVTAAVDWPVLTSPGGEVHQLGTLLIYTRPC